MSFPKLSVLIALCLWLSFTLSAQPASLPVAPKLSIDNDFVQKQFGSTCALIGIEPLKADLDGDGIEDIVIPARCTNPMMDQTENSFVVIDPYDSFFGYGNPKITTQFSTEDPERRGFSLLVIHGAGSEAWRSNTPKAKFIIVNLPFKQVVVKKLAIKKNKRIMAIFTEENSGDQMTSVVFWDGKRYKYQPLGSSME